MSPTYYQQLSDSSTCIDDVKSYVYIICYDHGRIISLLLIDLYNWQPLADGREITHLVTRIKYINGIAAVAERNMARHFGTFVQTQLVFS